ncbi:MAG: PDZ domain-containing protein, partial [Anaerolineae bacterium]
MLKARRGFLWLALLALVILGGGLIISGALRGQTVYASEGQGALPPWAAISPQTEEEEEEGIAIVAVAEDSPAERAGVKRGDILLALDGELVSDPGDVVKLLASREPG